MHCVNAKLSMHGVWKVAAKHLNSIFGKKLWRYFCCFYKFFCSFDMMSFIIQEYNEFEYRLSRYIFTV